MMENAFTFILNMSITASIAAVLIILLRWVLGRRFPKTFGYALWAIVLVRLLFPFSFTSMFSIFNTIPAAETILKNQQHHEIHNIFPNQTQNGSMSREKTGSDLLNSINSSLLSPTPEKSVDPIQVQIFVLSGIWLLGAAGLFSFSIYGYLRASRRLNEAILYNDDYLVSRCRQKVNLNRKVKIYTSDRIHTPVVCGLLKPRVILPLKITEGCNELELMYIITHELVHIKRFDYIIKPLSVLALCLHWLNPVIWFSFILYQKDMEMACDEKVVSVFDTDIRSRYASSLVKLAVKQNVFLNGGLLAFGESNIKSRIKGIMKFRKTGFLMGAASIILLIAFGVILLTNGQYKNYSSKSQPIKAGNNADTGSRFAIYLVKETNTKKAMESGMDKLELERNPIISEKDIKLYHWSDHSIEISKDALGRIPNVPVSGIPFVMVADGERIYLGAFWSLLSSATPTFPVIYALGKPQAIKLSYPFKPEGASDPRNDKRIYKVLKETGKLTLKAEATATAEKSGSQEALIDNRLWEEDGWTYYLEQIPRGGVIPLDNHVGRLCRQNSEGMTETLDELVTYRNGSAVIFPAGNRIVFMGFAGTSVMDFKSSVIVSIMKDGSDRKTFNPEYRGCRQLCYDNGYLYFEGWTNDGAFPRPICRIDTEFKKNIKMADIDGSLVTVSEGYAYYLNGSIYRLKLDWVSKPEIWDKTAIGKNIVSIRKTADNEYSVVYDEGREPYILRLPGLQENSR